MQLLNIYVYCTTVYNIKQCKYILGNNYDGNPNLPKKRRKKNTISDFEKKNTIKITIN